MVDEGMSREAFGALILSIQLADLLRLADERVITGGEAGAMYVLACMSAVRAGRVPASSHWPSDDGELAVATLADVIDPARCPECGGFLGDSGYCVTVGCDGGL